MTREREKTHTFEALYDEYYDKVYVYIARRVRNRQDAEDLAADVFYKVFTKPYDPNRARFSSYVFTIAANTLKNYYRDSSRYAIPSEDEFLFEHSDGSDFLADLITKDEYFELSCLLANLSERHYDAIYRRYYLDESYREIAEALGITENNARQIHFEALKKLRVALQRREEEVEQRSA